MKVAVSASDVEKVVSGVQFEAFTPDLAPRGRVYWTWQVQGRSQYGVSDVTCGVPVRSSKI